MRRLAFPYVSAKIIHKNDKVVATNTDGKIFYQDFYNNFYLFDPQEGLEKKILSLSDYPYVIWKLHDGNIYYSTGNNLLKYSIETNEKTYLLADFDINEKIITDFSIFESSGVLKFIFQIHSFKSNEVVLFELL